MSHDTGTADRAVRHYDPPDERTPVIGRDAGTWSSWFRVLLGLTSFANLRYRIDAALDGRELVMVVVWLTVVASAYTAVVWFFGRIDRFRGVSPWIPAALLQLPMLLYPMGIGSDPLHQALAVYTSLGMLLCGAMRYGGLEVAAVPMLVLRRRSRIYSPFNTVDIIEQAFRRERTRGVMWATALALTVFVVLAYWWVPLLLSVAPVKDQLGDSLLLPGFWALLLVVPLVWFAAHTVRGRDRYRAVPVGQRWPGLAAAALLLLMPTLAVRQVPDAIWGLIMITGVLVGLATLLRLPFRRRSGTSRHEDVASSR
ncbi:DUF6410 domain-containing protein [Micromonospora sp. NPDC050187]|uniref:DUF6410 domain-containing protein n=1 Tax=Micromonospora sp. NPDC050187 TaxID=3364277 RepID=UPI0037ACA32A